MGTIKHRDPQFTLAKAYLDLGSLICVYSDNCSMFLCCNSVNFCPVPYSLVFSSDLGPFSVIFWRRQYLHAKMATIGKKIIKPMFVPTEEECALARLKRIERKAAAKLKKQDTFLTNPESVPPRFFGTTKRYKMILSYKVSPFFSLTNTHVPHVTHRKTKPTRKMHTHTHTTHHK